MEKQQIEFNSFELNSILDYIDTAIQGPDLVVNMLVGTWNAILRREGHTLMTVESLNPWAYAIPQSQWETINFAAMKRAKEIGLSDTGVANVGLEFVNKGPSAY